MDFGFLAGSKGSKSNRVAPRGLPRLTPLPLEPARTISAASQQEKTMTPELPPLVADYFAASNAHDPDAVAALFTEEGRVHDERQDHRGRAAIRGWAEQTFREYRMVQTPRQAREEGGDTVVRTGVSGNFPGSPIDLEFRFVVEGQRIRELKIG
jgi:hypothetical protein